MNALARAVRRTRNGPNGVSLQLPPHQFPVLEKSMHAYVHTTLCVQVTDTNTNGHTEPPTQTAARGLPRQECRSLCA